MKKKKFLVVMPTQGAEHTNFEFWAEQGSKNFYVGVRDKYGNLTRVTANANSILDFVSKIALHGSRNPDFFIE